MGAPLPVSKVAWEFPGDTGGRKVTAWEEGKKRAVMQIIKKVQMLPAAVEGMAENTKDSDCRR